MRKASPLGILVQGGIFHVPLAPVVRMIRVDDEEGASGAEPGIACLEIGRPVHWRRRASDLVAARRHRIQRDRALSVLGEEEPEVVDSDPLGHALVRSVGVTVDHASEFIAVLRDQLAHAAGEDLASTGLQEERDATG